LCCLEATSAWQLCDSGWSACECILADRANLGGVTNHRQRPKETCHETTPGNAIMRDCWVVLQSRVGLVSTTSVGACRPVDRDRLNVHCVRPARLGPPLRRQIGIFIYRTPLGMNTSGISFHRFAVFAVSERFADVNPICVVSKHCADHAQSMPHARRLSEFLSEG